MATASEPNRLREFIAEGTVFSKIAITSGPALIVFAGLLDVTGYDTWGGLLGALGVFFFLITVVSYSVIALLARYSQ